MRKRLFFTNLLVVLALLVSCKPELISEESTLRLSRKSIKFDAEKNSQVIQVETSRGKWTALSPEEATWLTLTMKEDGKSLEITADANTEARERKAKVMVMAEGLMEGFDVVQEAGAEQISLSRDVLHFTRQGGEDRLTFSTNGTGVTCETDISAPWITYDLDENQHLVTVSVKANDGNSRTVKLILRQGNSVAGVTVVQAGMARFWIPFLPTTGQTNIFRSIIDYETAQHSTQLGYNKADGEETIEFIPESEYFSKATYTLGDDQTMYEKVTTTFTPANVTHEQEFITKLVEVGFVKDLVRSQSAERVVYKLKNNPALSVLLEKKDDVIRITYAYTLQFATFPFNNYIGEAWQTVKAKVEETGAKEVNALDWDSEVDYYYSTSISGVTHYYTENKSSHEVVEEGLSFTAKYNSMVVVGNYMSFELTEDFSALLQEAGFEFVREEEVKRGSTLIGLRHIYQNAAEKREMRIQNLNAGLTIRYLPLVDN